MDPERIQQIYEHVASEFNLPYEKMVELTYHLLPKEFITNYNKISIYKNIAVQKLVTKYSIDVSCFSVNRKVKISDIKYIIKEKEKEIFFKLQKQYLYLVLFRYLGISVTHDLYNYISHYLD